MAFGSLSRLAASTASALACFGLLGCDAHGRKPAFESSMRVQSTIRRFATQLVILNTSESTVVTTPEHRFAKRAGGWTPAIQLATGDQIERRDSAPATILDIEVRDVSSTPVYNLTVAKTHSYFVSSQELLVHNEDCGASRPKLGELLKKEREAETQAPAPRRPRLGELLKKEREAETRARAPRRPTLQNLLEREKWSEQRDPILNDTYGMSNCSVCSFAGLSDADKLTTFLSQHEDNLELQAAHERGLPPLTAVGHLRDLGLVGPTTPPRRIFPDSKNRQPVERTTISSQDPNFPLWPDVTQFMQNSGSNTFYVEIDYWTPAGARESHSILAVRDVDGSIKYVDMQQHPPRIFHPERLRMYRVEVVPTDVDWRFTHNIYRFVTGAKSPPGNR